MSEDYSAQDLDARCERFYDGANRVFARVFSENPVARFVKGHAYAAVGILIAPAMYVGLMAFYRPEAAEVARQEEVLLGQKQKAKKSYWQRLMRQKEKTLDPVIDGFLGKGN